jgi:hypothetical protein
MHDYPRLADAGRWTLWFDFRYGHQFLDGKPVEGLLTPNRLPAARRWRHLTRHGTYL